MKDDIRNEDMLQEIMTYGAVIREIRDAAEQLRAVWDDESGKAVYERIAALTEEMNDNYEGLRRWIGSGSF